MNVVVVAPTSALRPLAPLLARWTVEHVSIAATEPPDTQRLSQLASGADAVLLVASRRRSPRTVLPGPTLTDPAGRPVAVGWLPQLGDEALQRFAEAAAAVHTRVPTTRSVGVLGQRLGRYDDLAGRIARLLGQSPHVRPYRWTSYELRRDDLVEQLGRGPAAAIYVGHARPIGWVGYAGIRAHHFPSPPQAPVGAVLSLTCNTASRRRTGLSFCEALVTRGVCAAAVGAVGATRHTSNARWALRVAASASTATSVGELIADAAGQDPYAASYRLVGDPTAPLYDDAAFGLAAARDVA